MHGIVYIYIDHLYEQIRTEDLCHPVYRKSDRLQKKCVRVHDPICALRKGKKEGGGRGVTKGTNVQGDSYIGERKLNMLDAM